MSWIFATDAELGLARRGLMTLLHAEVETSVFMPVGIGEGGAAGCGRNAGGADHPGQYVLLVSAVGLSSAAAVRWFISWERAMLTDAGGFQVFSLNELRKVTDKGVQFRSHLDGPVQAFAKLALRAH